MDPDKNQFLASLSEIQKQAASVTDGAVLLLAGPGSGKTRVLTNRIALILDQSRKRNFRVLALTFTTKAALEMRERVELLVPDLVERVFIGTFHAFCTQLIRQHGSHISISPDFTIFDQDNDRQALLADALSKAQRKGAGVRTEDAKWLKTIDQLKSKLVTPEKTPQRFNELATGKRVAEIYALYEQALLERNSMDFNGLILGACRLLRDAPGVAERTRQTYQQWLIDEFQDTSPAQYRLLQLAAGPNFKNVFAVADDDQIIYQWAGASYKQIERFRADFTPQMIQLVENHRCPAEIVSAANRLVAHNTSRTPEKQPLTTVKEANPSSISVRLYETDADENAAIATDIASRGNSTWGSTAILGRTRSLLLTIQKALAALGVKSVLAQRRDRFISPEFTWLQACLDQALRPNDIDTFRVLVDASNRVSGEDLDPSILASEAEASGLSYLDQWAMTAQSLDTSVAKKLGELGSRLATSRSAWRAVIREAIPILVSANLKEGVVSDAHDDKAAWEHCTKEIRAELGPDHDLSEFMQGLALRSKEPPRDPDAVSLLTVHAAKGLEFDTVFVAGMAESIMPSWQSLQKGEHSPEMEEERRNCFVAITRTRQQLVLTLAKRYGNWTKEPSRFLSEMELTAPV